MEESVLSVQDYAYTGNPTHHHHHSIPADIRTGHLSSTSQKLYVQTAAQGAPI